MALNLTQQFFSMRVRFSDSVDDMHATELTNYEKALEEVFQAAKQHKLYVLEKAKILEHKKEYDQALSMYQQSSRYLFGNAFTLLKEAVCLKHLGRIDEAMEKYIECIFLDTEIFMKAYTEKHLSKVNLKRKLVHKLGIGKVLCSVSTAQKRHIQEAIHDLAELFYDEKKFYEAADFFSNIKPSSFFYRDAVYCIARSYCLLTADAHELPAEEIEKLKNILEKNPEFSEAWAMLGEAYELNREIKKALYCYGKILEVEPSSKETIIEIARLLQSQENHEGVIRLLEDKVKLYGDEPQDYFEVLCWLTKSYYALENYHEAVKVLKKAEPVFHDRAEYWNKKGVCLWPLGRHEESIKAFEKARVIDPDNYYAINNLADCYMNLDLHENAISLYKLALSKGSENIELYGRMAISLSKSGRVKEALALFDEMKQSRKKIPGEKFYKAMVFKNAGKTEEAIAMLKEFMEEDGAKEDECLIKEMKSLYEKLGSSSI